jgi:hypothetical protein
MYNKHHQEKLIIETSLYNLCLIITITKGVFRVIGIQTDNILILSNNEFIKLKEEKLTKARLIIKPKEALLYKTLLIFNRCILRQEEELIVLIQKGQGKKI